MEKKWRKPYVVVFLLLGFLFLSGQFSSSQSLLEKDDPNVITLALASSELASVLIHRWEPLAEYIEEVTGIPVAFYVTTSIGATAEGLAGEWIHVASIGPFGYVIAKEMDPNIDVFCTFSNISMPEHFVAGGPGYKGMLITKKGSEYEDIKSLEGATVAFADPASTSGYLLPFVAFTRDVLGGESLDSFFGELYFAGSHDAVIFAVLENRVDAGFTWEAAPYRLWQRGAIEEPAKELNVLWFSERVPLSAYCYQTSTLSPQLQEKIAYAFYTWHEQPQAEEFLQEMGITGFPPITDQEYDIIRELRDAMEN